MNSARSLATLFPDASIAANAKLPGGSILGESGESLEEASTDYGNVGEDVDDGQPDEPVASAVEVEYRRCISRLRPSTCTGSGGSAWGESDPAKAREARKQAADWAWTYASYATSGGEGAALSYERDQFLTSLGPEPFE